MIENVGQLGDDLKNGLATVEITEKLLCRLRVNGHAPLHLDVDIMISLVAIRIDTDKCLSDPSPLFFQIIDQVILSSCSASSQTPSS